MAEPSWMSRSVSIPWAVVLAVTGLATGAGTAAAGGAATRTGDLEAVSARIEDVADQADRHLSDALATRDAKLDAVLSEIRALREEVRELRAEGRAR